MADSEVRSKLLALVDEAIERWRGGETPDAAEFLVRHPEVGSRKSLALDLIHEELCLRKESGVTIVPSTFIDRFPEYQRSIAKMLEVERFGDEHPDALAELAESRWPKPGESFSGFEIIEPLGRGALARVYLARETAMGRRAVAVKISYQGGHEAHLLGKLQHENIVPAHSVRHDEVTGLTVICMPFAGTATGLDLLDLAFAKSQPPARADVILRAAQRYQPAGLVKPESLSCAWPFARRTYAEGVAWIGWQLARGLAAAHGVGIVHRDIKPSNVLLAWSGRPMLLDFNLSTDLDEQVDRLGGTLAYMAPERIFALLIGRAAEESAVDPRADVFSLGAVLYELLTGQLPSAPAGARQDDWDSLDSWLAARGGSVVPPSRFNAQVDAPLDRILLRSLSAEPTQRFASADELAANLSSYLGWRQRSRRWARSHRRQLLLGAVAAAALTAGGVAWWANLPTTHDYHYRRGLDLYRQGQFALAVRSFDHALAAEPDSVAALFARAQSHYRRGDMSSAQRDYLTAATLDDQALFWFCAGCCGVLDGRDSAAEYLLKALARGHREAEVYFQLGLWNVHRPKPERGIPNFTRFIELDPTAPQPYYLRAKLRMDQIRDPNDALLKTIISDIETALAQGPPARLVTKLAIRAYDFAAREDQRYQTKAQNALKLLIAQGEPRDKILQNSLLARILAQIPDADQLAPDPAQAAPLELPPFAGPPADAELPAAPPRS